MLDSLLNQEVFLFSDPYANQYREFCRESNANVPRKDRGRKAEPVRTEPKIGRNEPCPCGSGKKYKHCCHGK